MIAFEIAVIVLLIVLNGVFALSELAVVSSRKVRLEQMAGAGHRGAHAALRMIEEPGRFLSTVQIGITLIGIGAGAFGGATLARKLGVWLNTLPIVDGRGDAVAFGIVVIAITYLSLIVGELVPKRIALANPERTASLVALPMRQLSRIASPMVWLLGTSTDLVLRMLGLAGTREATVTEEEVKSMINEGTRAGVFAPQEREMINGVLRLADRIVRSIMTPRPDVVWLDVTDPPDAVVAEIKASGHSRFPVCRGDLDEVVGVVHARALLDLAFQTQTLDLEKAMRPALVVHDRMPILKLLDLMRGSTRHFAVVVDEYGSVEGVVTLTDILETIAGELPETGVDHENGATRRGDGSWLVDGSMPVDAFEDKLGIHGLAGDGDFQTVAGFMLHHLGHLPAAGEAFERDGVRYEVVDMDGRRIDKVLVVPPKPDEPSSII